MEGCQYISQGECMKKLWIAGLLILCSCQGPMTPQELEAWINSRIPAEIDINYRAVFARKILITQMDCEVKRPKEAVLSYDCPKHGKGEVRLNENFLELKPMAPRKLERWILHNTPSSGGFFDCEEHADIAVLMLQKWGYSTKRHIYSPVKANASPFYPKLTRHVAVDWEKDGVKGRILEVI